MRCLRRSTESPPQGVGPRGSPLGLAQASRPLPSGRGAPVGAGAVAPAPGGTLPATPAVQPRVVSPWYWPAGIRAGWPGAAAATWVHRWFDYPSRYARPPPVPCVGYTRFRPPAASCGPRGEVHPSAPPPCMSRRCSARRCARHVAGPAPTPSTGGRADPQPLRCAFPVPALARRAWPPACRPRRDLAAPCPAPVPAGPATMGPCASVPGCSPHGRERGASGPLETRHWPCRWRPRRAPRTHHERGACDSSHPRHRLSRRPPRARTAARARGHHRPPTGRLHAAHRSPLGRWAAARMVAGGR